MHSYFLKHDCMLSQMASNEKTKQNKLEHNVGTLCAQCTLKCVESDFL